MPENITSTTVVLTSLYGSGNGTLPRTDSTGTVITASVLGSLSLIALAVAGFFYCKRRRSAQIEAYQSIQEIQGNQSPEQSKEGTPKNSLTMGMGLRSVV